MLIGFAGNKAGCGKDTAGIWCTKNLGMCREMFARPIKEMLNIAFGWTMDQWEDKVWKEEIQPRWGFSPRFAAQKLGTEWRDSMNDCNLWIRILEARWGAMITELAITDVRFSHEQDWVHARGGLVVYINRPDALGATGGAINHISELALDFNKVDITIFNDGTIEKFHNDLAHIFNPPNQEFTLCL